MKIVRASLHHNTRGLMYQLMLINIIVIIMDMGLLGMEYASLFLVQAISKGVFYSIKLKLELAILNRLVKFVQNDQGEFIEMDSSRGRTHSDSSR